MMSLEELAAWLDDTGHEQCAEDLRTAADDRVAVAYDIAEHVEEMCGAGTTSETEKLPDQLRRWADQEEFTNATD